MIRRIIDRLTGWDAARATDAWVRMRIRHARLCAKAHAVIVASDAADRASLEDAVNELRMVLEGEQ